jgi:kinesin family protein 11
MSTNVQVAVRCRPLNAEEKRLTQPNVIVCDTENRSLKVAFGPNGKKISKSYTFDKVFGMYSTQKEVFEGVVRPIVDEALAGFNCTIFAYGQTGTGKTHTMEGDIHSEEHAGIVPRTVNTILQQLEASDSEYTIRVSFLELYNEELQDLLNTSGDRKLKLCEDLKKGVVCQNLEEITVLNAGDIFEILQKGILQRQTAETMMNKSSSRSHSIFTMKIMIKEYNVDGEEVVRHGQLNLVDLAGSECIGRSGAKNDRAREAGSINQSLLTLGRVITALVDHHGHIPYRDSKLTRLLQESLGGRAKTCIIATLSPSQLAVEETMSTLEYAYRAKSIKNVPIINEKKTKQVVLKEYCTEIENLKIQLQLTREKNGVYVDPEQWYSMESRIQTQVPICISMYIIVYIYVCKFMHIKIFLSV